MIDVERLGQILERAALERRDRAVEVGIRGHDDHRNVRKPLTDVVEQRQARLAGHANIRHQDLRLTLLQRLQHVACGCEGLVGDALAGERLLEHPPDRSIVVDDPDGLHQLTLHRLIVVIDLHAGSNPSSLYAPGRLNSSGSKIVNTVRPGTLTHSIAPLCWAMNVCAIVSPSPLPPSRPDTNG